MKASSQEYDTCDIFLDINRSATARNAHAKVTMWEIKRAGTWLSERSIPGGGKLAGDGEDMSVRREAKCATMLL